MRRARSAPLLIGSLSLAMACADAAPQGPIRIPSLEPAAAAGHAYRGELRQVVVVQTPHGEATIERELRVRFAFDAADHGGIVARLHGAHPAPDEAGLTVRLDSVHAAVTSPHGRMLVDTRALHGATFALHGAAGGDPPHGPAAAPAVDYGELGGAFPLALIVDEAAPDLPREAVRTGESWERVRTRTLVEGNEPVERRITSRYTLVGFERRGGATLARIEVAIHAAAPDSAAAAGGAGPLDGTGWILIGVDDGVVREAGLDESVAGTSPFAAFRFPFRQTTTLRLVHDASR